MIQCSHRPVSQSRTDEILKVLTSSEIDEVIRSIGGEIAALEATASNLTLAKPLDYISGHGKMPPLAESAMVAASKLQIFLDVLGELRRGARPITTTTLNIATP